MQGKRRLVSDSRVDLENNVVSLLSKTRRWGRGNRARTEQMIFENRFISIAPVWFYSLIGYFVERKNESSLWSGHIGATLLARMLVTLAVIVESCGNHPTTDVLARDLFELAWGFRTAEVAEVRACVLTAVATCIASVREETLVRLIAQSNDSGSMDNLPRYLRETANADPDESCRTIAVQIASQLRHAHYGF